MSGKKAFDPRVYWIWAQQAFGQGSPKPWQLFNRFPGGWEEFYDHGPSLWNRMEMISEKEASSLFHTPLEQAEALLEYCEKMGQQVITPECDKYPEALRNIFDPPAVLYYKGKLPSVDTLPAIAVVGARKASEESVSAAKGFGFQLASGGEVVVSGGAVGIDAAALMGAVSAMGPAVSVLPACLESHYVAENESLRQLILERGGCLLSEYAVERSVQRGAFQIRNRLLSGLCCGTLVIQAGAKSGTMITARHAKEQDRDVFVFPGPEGDPAFSGSRSLMEDGAKAVTCGEEILEEFSLRFAKKKQQVKEELLSHLFDDMPIKEEKGQQLADAGSSLSSQGIVVLQVLGESPIHISEIGGKTGLAPAAVWAAITELELEEKIRSFPGQRYART